MQTTLTANERYWGGRPGIKTIQLVHDIGGRSPIEEAEDSNFVYYTQYFSGHRPRRNRRPESFTVRRTAWPDCGRDGVGQVRKHKSRWHTRSFLLPGTVLEFFCAIVRSWKMAMFEAGPKKGRVILEVRKSGGPRFRTAPLPPLAA